MTILQATSFSLREVKHVIKYETSTVTSSEIVERLKHAIRPPEESEIHDPGKYLRKRVVHSWVSPYQFKHIPLGGLLRAQQIRL